MILIDAHPELSEIIALDTPLKRMVYTKDVVGPVLYFISDLSSMLTATCNVIDGGLLNSTLLVNGFLMKYAECNLFSTLMDLTDLAIHTI